MGNLNFEEMMKDLYPQALGTKLGPMVFILKAERPVASFPQEVKREITTMLEEFCRRELQ